MRIDLLKRLGFFLLLATLASAAVGISLFEISSVAFLAVSLVCMALDADRKRALGGCWTVFFAVYFAANLLSLTQSQYMGDSLKGMLRVFRLIGICLSVIYTLDTEEKFAAAFRWVLGVSFAVAVDGLVQSVTGLDPLRRRTLTAFHGDVGRVTATFGQANDFAGYLTLPVFYALGLLVEAGRLRFSKKAVAVLLAGLAAVLACLLWTYSRGAWVGVGAAFVFFALLKRRKILIGALAAVLLWALFLSPPLVRQRFQSLTHPTGGTFTERKILAGEAVAMIESSPWLGLGLNTFSRNAPRFKSKEHVTDVQYLHNGYLQIAVETGAVGLASFLAVLLHFFVSGFGVFLGRAKTFVEAAGAGIYFGLLAFLVHSAADTNLQSLLLVSGFWIALGFGWSAIRLARTAPA